jgi:hypothetical protein
MPKMIRCILCLFAEFFCSDPDLKSVKTINKTVVAIFPQIIDRGCGVRDGQLYLQYQSKEPCTQNEASFLAKKLKQQIELSKKELSKPIEALLIFKSKSDGEFYQIDLQSDTFDPLFLE